MKAGLIMSFEIQATDIGPIIINNGQFIALTSEDAMIEVCQEDGERFNIILNHITDELKSAFDLYLEGFSLGLNPPSGKVYAYMAAYHQFWMFKNVRFAQFLSALQGLEDDE